MYATNLHCFCCSADFPLTHRGSCTLCARPGEESALNETLGVQYDLAALKRQLDREELARRPAGLRRYRELLPVIDPTFRIDLGAGGTRLAPLTRISEAVAGNKLFMKVEGSNPSSTIRHSGFWSKLLTSKPLPPKCWPLRCVFASRSSIMRRWLH